MLETQIFASQVDIHNLYPNVYAFVCKKFLYKYFILLTVFLEL